MIILRKVLFFIFLGVYLIVCPLVILYSLGYIYAPRTEEGIVKTGLIHLESLPAGASVSLNDEMLPDKTPCTLGELLEGPYHVRVHLRGYRAWSQTVDVRPGKASVFSKILLLPEKLKSNVLVPQPFRTLVPVPATKYLLLFSGRKLCEATVFDWSSESFRQLISGNSSHAREEVRRSFVSKRSPHVLFEVQGRDTFRYFWADLRAGGFELRDLSNLFRQGRPDDVQWEGNDPDHLFASYQGNLSRLDLRKKTVLPALMEGLNGYGIHRGKIYGVRKDSLICMDSNAKKGEQRAIESGRFWQGLFHDAGPFRLAFFRNDAVFFIGEKGQLISNLLPYRFMESGLKGYSPDASSKKVLVWTDQELGIFSLEGTDREGSFFERGPAIDWFWRGSGGIGPAYLAYDDSHVLFREGDYARLLEIGTQPPVSEEIARLREESVPFYSEKTGKLYFLEPENGYLMSLEIIPEDKLLKRVFGEVEMQGPQEEP